MDYRTRRLEQRRHQRLGCFIQLVAVLAGMIGAHILLLFFPTIPIAGTIAFYALGVTIAGAIERRLRQSMGYHARKASLQTLKFDSDEAPLFASPEEVDSSADSDSTASAQASAPVQTSDPPGDASDADGQTTRSSFLVKICPHCETKVAPKPGGICPACQGSFPE
ncbi:MAG: hypothetical protein CMJ48_02290 [Planctomycetaceae bacterium]|nr:hypothetical protein [Planctomycetaceae bacterium]